MIASFSALMTRISEGTKVTHICLVYFQDEIQPERTKNEEVVQAGRNKETTNSTCQRKVKKENQQIPHSHKMFIVLRIEIALIKKAKTVK